jgi:hypothetical protein
MRLTPTIATSGGRRVDAAQAFEAGDRDRRTRQLIVKHRPVAQHADDPALITMIP